MLHECSPRKTLGDSHALRKCFHRTSLKTREGHNDDKMGRKRDDKSRLYRKLFDPGVRHSGRSSLSGGRGHHFYLAVGVQEFRPLMSGS